MSVTIRDIARESGFSIATVSRAFSANKTVKPETRQLVMQIAQKLGYQYKIHSSRDANQEHVVMLVAGDIMNLFYLGIIKGVNDKLSEQGIKLAIFNSDYDPTREEDFVRYANDNNYDGIILITAMETFGLISLLKKISCPVVLANRFIRSMDLNAVCIDNSRGGYMATSYLIEMGHRKIAHLAGQTNSTASQDRERGFRDAMRDHQLPVDDAAIRYGNLKKDSGVDFGSYFRSNLRDYTAVFCANDLMATGFCESMIAAGFAIPDDVSVISYDDSPAAISGPVKLTTISRDPYPLGYAAGEMMIEALTDKEIKCRKVVFPPDLIERQSVCRLKE